MGRSFLKGLLYIALNSIVVYMVAYIVVSSIHSVIGELGQYNFVSASILVRFVLYKFSPSCLVPMYLCAYVPMCLCLHVSCFVQVC